MWGDHQSAAESYLDWWRLAGVDSGFHDEPTAFLAPRDPGPFDDAVTVVPADRRPDSSIASSQAGLDPTARDAASTPAPSVPLPTTLADFATWWMSPNAPGAHGLTATVAPQGAPGAPLMLLADFPDDGDAQAGGLFAGTQGKLLTAMLKAAGLPAPASAHYVASLIASRPPGGIVGEDLRAVARAVALHHIGLVNPARLLLIGTAAGKIFAEAGGAPETLRGVNLNGHTIPSWIVPHPRHLLTRPLDKSIAWRELKLLARSTSEGK